MNAGAPWDIFCKVIDNFGDIGVCWRLAADLAARGQPVRLWVDDASALQWMAPQGQDGVRVMPWPAAGTADWLSDLRPGAVVIEAFGCELDAGFVAAMAAGTPPPAWINLEYLSAEAWVERSHGLPSPQRSGLAKHFYFPGFTPATGGLPREPGLAQRQAGFDRAAWLAAQGIAWQGESLISLFCYEPAALSELLAHLAQEGQPCRLLVTPGRAAAAVRAALANPARSAASALTITQLPLLSQHEFDHLLWACDLNFVRGEDSLVRAIWAGKPLVWQAYPQDGQAHRAKLEALLEGMQASESLRHFHRVWNGLQDGPLPGLQTRAWSPAAAANRLRLLAQEDLASQLLKFVRKTR